jgi:BRCT domain type II-containing protein
MSKSRTVNQKYHFWLFTQQVNYVRDGSPKTFTTNVVAQSEVKNVTQSAIDAARQQTLQRVIIDLQIPQEDLRNLTVLNISHLGFMSEKEFNDIEEDEAQPESPFKD